MRPDGATWRSGYAPVCKTVYTSSILVVASINTISGLRRAFERPIGGVPYQQAAYQPSGNGTSGQAAPLSLAALGGALKIGRPATMKSSSGMGATAVRTASSNRSNSASLIARSHVRNTQRRKSPLFPD